MTLLECQDTTDANLKKQKQTPKTQPKLLRVLSLNYPQSKLTLRETVCMKAGKIRYETKMNKKQT